MEKTLEENNLKQFLRTVPYEKGFHFTLDNGVFTGFTASSLSEFAAKLETIDLNSVQFHYTRGDFQKWIQDTLGDGELANRMCLVKVDLSGELLRKQLLKIVQKRINELRKVP